MPGVRIRHPQLKNCLYVVPILDRPYPGGPIMCDTCERQHPTKTYHLRLDDQGAVIVSETIAAELIKAGMANMTIENEVANPPPVSVGMTNKKHDRKRKPELFVPVERTRGRRYKKED